MRGKQAAPFVIFPPDGKPAAFPPTGREFAVRHCHVFRFRDGLASEHIAVRDDLGMMTQLGHLPPGPAALARMARFQLSGQAGRRERDQDCRTGCRRSPADRPPRVRPQAWPRSASPASGLAPVR